MTVLPVAVLTNSSLLSRKEVRKALLQADIVIPSLDAATPEVFRKINRPHPFVKIEDIIKSLVKFRKEYKGKIWLEVMLVKGVNDTPFHLRKLKKAIELIAPDKVQLNTVSRPPSEKFARPLNEKDLKKIKRVLGGSGEIVAHFKKKEQTPLANNLQEAVLALVRRRPVTLYDISVSLGKGEKEILRHLDLLLKQKKLKAISYGGLEYYEPG